MAFISVIDKASKAQSADTSLLDKALWALRQRLRKQLNQLSGSFFDEVDDFIFEAGKLGQLTGESDYLGAMREIRAKQVLFEERFLDAVSEKIEQNSLDIEDGSQLNLSNSESSIIFESMEIELAIATMARKANRFYQPYIKQIDSLNIALGEDKDYRAFDGRALVSSVLLSFVEAQVLINISLEIRLVVLKLFEQHFLMRLEKLFLDCISILNNIENKQFVERLYSSSSSFHVPVAKSCTTEPPKSLGSQQRQQGDSKAVESSVSEVLELVRNNADVPSFVREMAEEHWRMVLLLIGLNKGVSGIEWQEAKHALEFLVLCSSRKIETNTFDESLLLEKLTQGMRLLRTTVAEEQQFIEALKLQLAMPVEELLGNESNEQEPIEPEATLSPSGENVLDAEDLNEIAKLISGEATTHESAQSEDRAKIVDCLVAVDRMSACCSVQIKINEKLHDCVVTRSGEDGNVFVITNVDSSANSRKIALTRSRLGFALSLQSAEIVFLETSSTSSKITVFEKKS